MSELKIKTEDCELIIPAGKAVEISGDGLVLEFNAQGRFTLTRDDKLIGSSRPGQPVDPKAGDVMPDGSICGGISPETGKPFFATAQDAPSVMDHWKAVAYAEELDAHGRKDWRLPTASELDVLYRNKNTGGLNGTFNESGSFPGGWYWSSSEVTNGNARNQRFSAGYQNYNNKDNGLAVRCVRG